MDSPVLPQPRLIFFSKSVIEPSLIESLHLALKSGTDYHYRHAPTLDEVKEIVNRSTRVVWLANCSTKEEIGEIYPALSLFESRIADGTIKIFLLNTARHPKLRDIVRARVGVEVVDLPITTKALQYKLKNALMSVHQNYLKISTDVIDTSILVGADAKTALRTKPKVLGADVLWQPAVEFDYDFWWVPDGKSIRLVVGVWLVDLIGPSPAAGTWDAVSGMGVDGERAWVWRSRWLADEVFQTREGRWIFFGKQIPEFSVAKNTWCFMGKKPKLAYFADGSDKPKYVRFEYRTEDGFLACENSASAKTLLPLIQATFAQVPGRAKPAEPAPRPEDADSYDTFEVPKESAIDEVAKNLLTGKSTGPLTPASELGFHLGLGAVSSPGVAAGAKSFARTSIGVDVVRKNGELGDADMKSPSVYHVTKTGATLLLEPPNAEIGDRFHFRFKFGNGDSLAECMMEWEMTEIEMAFEQKLLAKGEFVSGDLAPLSYLLDKLEDRKRELKEFYQTARG